ncbi:unnamed protein product [Ixodes hexagonus]
MHFDYGRKRASLMAYAGSTLAAVLYPTVLIGLVDAYGLHGALLVTAGFALNGLAGSVMLRKYDAAVVAAGKPPTSGRLVVVCSVLTAPTLTSAMVLYDYVAVEMRHGSTMGISALTVQCLLNGGMLFLMSLVDVGALLVGLGLGFGWTSGSLITLMVPVLKSTLDTASVQTFADLARFAAAASLPLGAVLVGVFKDSGGSYSGLLLVSGVLSLVGGFIWLPAIFADSKPAVPAPAQVNFLAKGP